MKAGLISLAALLIISGIGYGLFYAPWLKVTAVTYDGILGGHQDAVGRVVDNVLGRKILGIPIGRDILFIRAGALAADLTSQFSFIQNITIQKKYFHTLKITATERQAEGVWCFDSGSLTISPDCRYFDNDGVTFGQAIQSSGVLLLNVDDMRVQSASASLVTVDQRFLKAIQAVVPALTSQGVKVKNITIPVDTYTEFDILVGDPASLVPGVGIPTLLGNSAGTSSYLIKFSLDSDIQSQLDVFRIFRTQKMADGTLHPQYIDLRFDGRVYYR